MRVARLFLSVSISFSLSISLAAQQTATSSPQALQLLQRSLSALVGGQTLTDVTLSGTARRIAGSDDESGTVTYGAMSNGASRFDFSYPSGPRSEVHTDGTGDPLGTWSGPDGTAHPLAFHNLANRSDIFPAFTLAQLAPSRDLVVTLVGQETKNGHPAYHLSMFLQKL